MTYDLIIIGAGPAGLSAGIYAGRYRLKTKVISADIGGLMSEAWKVENYPGFISISGAELAKKMRAQVKNVGVEIEEDEVVKLKEGGEKTKLFQINTKAGKNLEAYAIILALGTQRRKLNVNGEEEFYGKGVSYCATCDAPLFKDKVVVVVGGGDSACTSALLLSKHAKKVYLLVRGDKLTGEPINVSAVSKSSTISINYGVEVKEIKGDGRVESVLLNNEKEIKTDGVFIEIGSTPASALTQDLKLETNEAGYIKVDEFQRTNKKFIYAAGDVSTGGGGLRQIITAASQGAIAATSAYKDLQEIL